MRVSVVLGLGGLALVLPYGILLLPLYVAYWTLRPYRSRPVVGITGPKIKVAS